MNASSKNSSSWEECFHPNGWKYLYHPELHAISGSNHPKVNNSTYPKALDSTFDVLLDQDGEVKLIVDHHQRYAASTLKEVQDIREEMDKRRVAYWKFMCDFPAHRPLQDCGAVGGAHSSANSKCDAFHSAKQVLNFFQMDLLRRRSDSEAPFTLEQCTELLTYLNAYEEPDITFTTFPGIPSQISAFTALISWILWTGVKHKIRHNYGGYMMGETEQLQHQPSCTVTCTNILFQFVSSTLLFGAPRSHYERISTALSTMELQDRTDSWTAFLARYDQELTVSNLGSTVLLSSSSAFLAVPGIDNFTRIVTLISIILTLGSVMTGLYLQWQTGKVRFKDIDVNKRALALVFSIPFAALVWSIILFTASVIMYSVLGTLNSPATFGSATWIPTLTVSCVFAVIVGAVVFIFRIVRYKHSRNPEALLGV
ncbi:hypothetical protein BT96DRAFT_976481 [Gymnopus androsaceus JB14]|uniref:Uncharacterized protein n=1 Tax=Gymnopus androsaceus JB14 TaxID=1447944 RepID=A0A6A4HIK4_9AGAR|nr:hypothetical protein BT96DRAFT_976481 [Gymnopus androsaceus JB14]